MNEGYEPVQSLLHDNKDSFRTNSYDQHSNRHSIKFTAAGIGLFQLILFVLYGVTFAEWKLIDDVDFSIGYTLFLGVEIMMFIGFGYLMTFLKEYGIGAIGLTMMITVVGMQWALFTDQFFAQVYQNEYGSFSFSIINLIESLYAVAAVLISFGGVIGKLSPLQLLVMTIVELFFYSINNQVFLVGALKLVDVGGTVIIHMFGAYFGLAVAYIIGNPGRVVAAVGYVPDMFAFIGTLFLWIYWPSFVCGALDDTGGPQQQRAVFATILSLASSSTVAFSLSMWLDEKGTFRPVDIQNATLAGGVAIGAVANLTLSPLIACLVGMLAGFISTYGFAVLQPYLENRIDLFDTCGIHNLHGMPSLLGGFFSVIIAAYFQTGGRNSNSEIYVDHAHDQWAYQLLGLIITFSFAIVTGLFTGYLLRYLGRNLRMPYFKDSTCFHSD